MRKPKHEIDMNRICETLSVESMTEPPHPCYVREGLGKYDSIIRDGFVACSRSMVASVRRLSRSLPYECSDDDGPVYENGIFVSTAEELPVIEGEQS